MGRTGRKPRPSDSNVIRFDITPGCATEEQYAAWQDVNNANAVFCRDCTPAYQSIMKREQRCKFPEVIFVWRKCEGENKGYEESIGTLFPHETDKICADPNPPMFRPQKQKWGGSSR